MSQSLWVSQSSRKWNLLKMKQEVKQVAAYITHWNNQDNLESPQVRQPSCWFSNSTATKLGIQQPILFAVSSRNNTRSSRVTNYGILLIV